MQTSCPDEAEIAELARGGPDGPRRAELERHVDECDACGRLVAELVRVFSSLDPPSEVQTLGVESQTTAQSETVRSGGGGRALRLPEGAKLGRYVVLEEVGAGAMGVVYAAYDPELDRKVALKLLQTEGPVEEGDALSQRNLRLLREAQAMARLQHPHVVTVHDVGTFEGRVFLAMEFVDGGTLREWSMLAPRRWRETLAMYRQAGEGLVAAHAAGLVHRDFKPDNVLVGTDGRVVVTDLGLARPVGELPARAVEMLHSGDATAWDETLTRTGALVGTPAYMSPEQLDGKRAEAASDQFSFCVALYEALYAERPFAGRGIGELVASVIAGRVRPPAAGSNVPRWLRRVLLQGLAVNPSERHPDMPALLVALRPPSRPLQLTVGASAVVAVVAIGFGVFDGRQSHPLCAGADADLDTVWNDEARRAGRAAFVDTGHAAAESTWARVESKLDDYTKRWHEQFAKACRATKREGVTDLVGRSFGCLRRTRIQLETVVGLLPLADAETIPRAVRVVSALPAVEACTDASRLTTAMTLPEDAETRQAVETLREDVARVQIQLAAGTFDEALVLAREVLGAAVELSFAPLTAEAKLAVGEALEATGDYDAAHDAMREAFFEAQQADQLAIAARAAQRLTFLVGVRQGAHDQGLLWAEHARVALDKVGSSSARLLGDEASILDRLGRYDDAIAKYEVALARMAEEDGQAYEEAITRMRLGDSLRARGRAREALDQYQRAEDLFERELGEEHPYFANARISKGTALGRMGRTAEAIVAFEDGVQLIERTLGPKHPNLATALVNLGITLKTDGQYDRAAEVSHRALELTIAAFGPDHRNVAHRHDALGRLLTKLGQPQEALEHHARALVIHETALGASHPDTILTLLNVGEARVAAGHTNEALAAYEDAHRRSQALAEDDPMRADAAVYFAARLVEHGRADEAVALLEVALPVLEPLDAYTDVVAIGRFALARALWSDPEQHARARELATHARGALDAHPEMATALERWLAEHADTDR